MKGSERIKAIEISAPKMVAGVKGMPLQIMTLFRVIRATDLAVTSYVDKLLAPMGFNESELHTLMALNSCEEGRSSPSELSELVGQTRANTTRVLDVLVKGGWVRRSVNGKDGRRRTVRITDTGRELLRVNLPKLRSPLNVCLNAVKEADLLDLDQRLRQVVALLEDSEVDIYPAFKKSSFRA